MNPSPLLLVLAFRWLAFGWMAVVALVAGEIQRPGLAAATLLGVFGWTAWLTLAAPRRTGVVLGLDLLIAAALPVVGGLVYPPQSAVAGHPSFAGAYPFVAVAAWAVTWHLPGGLVAGTTLGLALPLAYAAGGIRLDDLTYLPALGLVATVLSYVLLGIVGGLVTAQYEALARRAAASRERAGRLAERLRLAGRLHDDTLQHLARLRARGGSLVARGGPLAAEFRALLVDLAREESALRELANRVATPDGRVPLDEALADVLAGSGVRLVVGVDVTLPREAADEVAAAVGELLANAAAHARASRVWCTVLSDVDGVTVTVRDDGIGFAYDEARLASAGRLGLRVSVRERIGALGGRVRVDSRPGRGTEVELWLPDTILRPQP